MKPAELAPIAILLACATWAFLENADDGNVEATARLVPTETLSGLPVAVELTLTNNGHGPATVPSKLLLYKHNVEITVETPDGSRIEIAYPSLCGLGQYPPPQTRLSPAASVRSKIWISSWPFPGGPRFSAPGEYRVFARVEGHDGEYLETPPQTVLVREPMGREKEAADLFEPLLGGVESQSGRFFERNESALENAESLAGQYGDTLHGKYARFLLAERQRWLAWSQKYRKTDNPVGHAARHREAVRELEWLRANDPPENISLEVQSRLASCYDALDRKGQAFGTLAGMEIAELPYPISEECRSLRKRLTQSDR